MKTQEIGVVSIHPPSHSPLALDIKDILAALKPNWDTWTWCIRNLDWLGSESETLCRQVEAAGDAGLWMSSQELATYARGVYQTIEGTFIAFPRGIDPATVNAEDLNLRTFPDSEAELAIVAVDGGIFDVLAKSPDSLTALRQLGDVRNEDPCRYI